MLHFHLQAGRGERRRLGRAPVLLIAAGLLSLLVFGLAACGTPTGPGGEDTTTSSPSASITHPTGSRDLVLRVEVGGGFVPIEYNLSYVPEFSLYGDGRVVVSGPVPAIYPGPALPNLQTTLISEETIQAILSAAKEAGLFSNGVDYGVPTITDVGSAAISLNAEGAAYRSDIYALGMEEGTGGLTLEQLQARAAIQDLRMKLNDLTAFTESEVAWAPYEFESLRVFSRAIDPANTPATDVRPNILVWPLADLATLGEAVDGGLQRFVVAAEDLTSLKSLLKEATAITQWTSGDGTYNLFFRPLLPDELT